MVLAICPLLAGEGTLNGLRGEYRRIEDQFTSLQMEFKMVQITFDVSGLHGNRSFPATLPAWMIVLDTTLGARHTFFKAPRNSERQPQDDNTFTRNDLWNLMSTKPTKPLAVSSLAFPTGLVEMRNPGDYATPESGTFFSHEQGRSLTDTSLQTLCI